ncbi:hypothetical protein [Brevundimonas sp. SL130]|uniref:hypothetical protein n=1 Tax=Brevundimonas sp. SL130 TaxID=2995143 RepID=UPI00226D1FAC|nr:hypothetical protein [Brevundimonas sp. SL130]WAC59641.1 hypothetical protein OU998_15710 [Brevundimonas sp. SL130]
MTAKSTLLDGPEGTLALKGLSEIDKLSPDAARALVEAVRAQSGRRRRGLFDQFDAVLSHDS